MKWNDLGKWNRWECGWGYLLNYICRLNFCYDFWRLFTKKGRVLNKPHIVQVTTYSREKILCTNPEIHMKQKHSPKAKKNYQGMIHPNANSNTEWIINTDNENGFVSGFSWGMLCCTIFMWLSTPLNSNQ